MKKNKVLFLILAVAMVISIIALPVGAEGETVSALTSGACPAHPEAAWTALTATGGALESGHYSLNSDLTLTSALTVAEGQTVCIDLNGYKLSASGESGVRVLEVNGALNLVDSVGTGVITGGSYAPTAGTADSDYCGGNVLVSGSAAALNLYSGTITGGIMNPPSYREHMFGANLAVLEGAVFHMYGGTVSDGNIRFDEQSTQYHGGGNIYVCNATVYIAGGTITGGIVNGSYTSGTAAVRRSYSAGGNLYAVDATVTIAGGTISDGQCVSYLKATSSTSTNTHLSNAFGGNIYAVGSTLSITGGTISGGSVDATAAITSASASGSVSPQGGNIYCGEASSITIGGDAIVTAGEVKNDLTSARGGNLFVAAKSAATLEGSARITDGKCPTGNARGGNIFVVGTLTINGGTIANGTAGWGANMMLQSGAKLDMNGGAISGGTGGTNVLIQRGTFTMTAGTIENSDKAMALSVQGTTDTNGGKAYITGGTLGNVATTKISELHISDAEIGTIDKGALSTVVVGDNVVTISNPTAFQTGEAAVRADGKFTTYAKLTDALAVAANTDATVYMAQDVNITGDVDIYSKLELNGKNLTATGVIDASNNDAAISDATGEGSASGADVKMHGANGMLGIDAENNGVVKYEKVTAKQQMEVTDDDTAYLKFFIDKAAEDTLLDEAILAGSNIKVRITVYSDVLKDGQHSFVYDADMVTAYAQDWNNKMFTCTITGLSLIEDCTITAQVISDGVVVSAKDITAGSATEGYYNTKWDGKTLKVLCVGNSFARNATKVLYQIAEAHGVEEIVLGVLYIGGCSVETHWNNAQSGEAAYSYYKNTSGEWEVTKNTDLIYGLQDEQWDVITITQGQGLYGIPESYDGCLEELIDYINTNKTNPDSQIAFHMTWAFPQDSTIERFSLYNYDQEYMFECIADTAKNRILPTEGIDFLLPSGSAIQNARTALGDIFSDDDRFHLGKIGEYVAGYVWFAYLTGQEVEELKYIDASVAQMQSSHQAILDAVNAALDDPFTVTQISK